MIDGLLQVLGVWSRLAQAAPWRWGLLGTAFAILACWLVARLVRARLELVSDRVAAGPIFAVAGLSVLAFALAWWLIDAILLALDQLLLEERVLLLLAPGGAEALRALLHLRPDQHLMPPAMVQVPLVLLGCAALYVTIVLWMGRTLAEMTSLEQKPEDVLAKERAAQRKAIAQALKEGRPMPAAEVVSVPLADDRLGRTFKLLGHWTSVELVEERFGRWQRPLVGALTATLLLALPAALGGHLGAPLWVGAAIALDGLRRNLKTPPKAPEKPAAEAVVDPAPPPPVPSLGPLLEAIHRETGVVAALPLPVEPQGAQISPGTDLEAKRVLDDLRRELELPDGLYVHQGLACDAFAARRNVLLTTPPLSGRQVLVDLLVFYTLLVDSENVLYLAASPTAARLAEERFRERAEKARWQWNVHSVSIAGRAGALDLVRTQPGLVFADPESLHLEICGKQRDWPMYLAGLGLVVLPDLDAYDGAPGAHLSHLLRRLRRAVGRAAPAGADRVRFIATAAPLFRDLGRFAERLVGRPFQVLGPEVDGAPRPARASYVLAPAAVKQGSAAGPWKDTPADLHPAVHSLGEALAQGFAAELFGFEHVLSSDDVARANEVMIARGVATRGRALAIGAERWGAPGDALAAAQVVIARASSAFFSSLPLLTAHVGLRAGVVPPPRVASLGAGEHVGRGAAPAPPKKPEPPPEEIEGEPGAERGTVPPPPPPEVKNAILVLWQPDLDPFALLLARERPSSTHPDLKHGCVLAVDPLAEAVQRDHLRATLAEGKTPLEELERDFTPALLAEELAQLRGASASTSASAGTARLVEVVARVIDASGAAREVKSVEIGGGADVHAATALTTSGPAARVVDRHTGELLFLVERERALSAAYPGRIFVHAGRRFAVLPIEQQDRISEHVIACEREERPLSTHKIRRLRLEVAERRTQPERRDAARAPGATAADRRAQPARTLGGAAFTLEHRRVTLVEEVIGLRRHGPDGRERDATAYADPIAFRYDVRAALVGLPPATFGEVGDDALHALSHLFRVTLPAFVHHDDHDLDVAWLPRFGDDGAPVLAFVDAHPGGVGFADAITLDVLRCVVRWSLALTRRCPASCTSPTGCPRCLQIERCRAEPARQHALDRLGADRVLALLVGAEVAATFGKPPAPP